MESVYKLYSFESDWGRHGGIFGLFIAKPEDFDAAMGQEVYLGEVLGKHSEVYFELDPEEFTEFDVSPEVIDELWRASGGTTISGYNPLEYMYDE